MRQYPFLPLLPLIFSLAFTHFASSSHFRSKGAGAVHRFRGWSLVSYPFPFGLQLSVDFEIVRQFEIVGQFEIFK